VTFILVFEVPQNAPSSKKEKILDSQLKAK